MDHSDLRTIAAAARKLLMAEASLFLDESEIGELGEERLTPAMVRAVLEAAEAFRTKASHELHELDKLSVRGIGGEKVAQPAPVVVIAAPSHAAYIERSNAPIAVEAATDSSHESDQNPIREIGEIRGKAVTPPAQDWPAKLLAAGLENGEAFIVAQLDAHKDMWRNVRRDTQRRIVYAVIRHIGGGEHVTGKQYDKGRPPWLPSNVLLYQQFAEKWSETVAAALEGVAAPTGAPFHAATTLAGRGS